jgi:hypothetical protein
MKLTIPAKPMASRLVQNSPVHELNRNVASEKIMPENINPGA